MSERGVFAVDRGIFDHPTLDDGEPFSRREAWLWMVSEAEWQPRKRKRGGVVVSLKRGQLAHSLRFMAAAWKWSEVKVRRFLAALKSDAMIDAQTDAGVTLVTICKYNEYQRVSLPDDAESGAVSDAEATQDRRKLEDREYITTPPDTGAPRDLDWVRSKLLAVGGVALSETATLVLSEPLRWLREGCDLDADVLPVIDARCRGQPRDRFKNLSYFSAAVFEARDRRLSPAPARAHRHAAQPIKSTHDRIRTILGRQSGGGDNEDRGGYSDPASGPIIDALAERLPHHPSQSAEIIAIGATRR